MTDEVKLLGAVTVTLKVVESVPRSRVTEGWADDKENTAMPVPETLALWGLPAALLVTLTAAVRSPVTVGAKVTEKVQKACGARASGQSFVWAK